MRLDSLRNAFCRGVLTEDLNTAGDPSNILEYIQALRSLLSKRAICPQRAYNEHLKSGFLLAPC